MRFILLISSGIASVIAGCGNPSVIEISNTIDEARKNEIVEILWQSFHCHLVVHS